MRCRRPDQCHSALTARLGSSQRLQSEHLTPAPLLPGEGFCVVLRVPTASGGRALDQAQIVLGVLIMALGFDPVAGEGLGLGQSEIALVIGLRGRGAPRRRGVGPGDAIVEGGGSGLAHGHVQPPYPSIFLTIRRSSWRLRPQGCGFQSGADFGGSVAAVAAATRLVSGDFSSIDSCIDIHWAPGRSRAVLR